MTSKYEMAARARKRKRKTSKFPDMNKDGKITRADIIMAIKKKNKKKKKK